jgi:uncharacterized protein DUF1579
MKRLFALSVITLLACSVAMAEDAAKPSAEQQAMAEKMMKAATPGPQHMMITKMAGNWDCTVKYQMDPSQPMQEEKSSATITTLMDGRYTQEVATGQMMGMPFNGMGLYGYDNVLGKYVSTWIDNMGTGIMKSEGVAGKDGKTINWVGTMSDPMTGKVTKERMVTTITDDDHHTFEMFGVPPGGKKEMKMMTLEYTRKQ